MELIPAARLVCLTAWSDVASMDPVHGEIFKARLPGGIARAFPRWRVRLRA